MGIYDQCVYKIMCNTCNKKEVGKVVDKGSNWSEPSWSNRVNFQQFNIEWETVNSVSSEPKILKAFCKNCSAEATISFQYGI